VPTTPTPTTPTPDPVRPTRRRPGRSIVALLTLAFALLLALRHDYWNWDTPRPLLFGFLPVGLWWQVLLTLLASALMAIMVRVAWPAHLEDQALEAERRHPDP